MQNVRIAIALTRTHLHPAEVHEGLEKLERGVPDALDVRQKQPIDLVGGRIARGHEGIRAAALPPRVNRKAAECRRHVHAHLQRLVLAVRL